MTPRIDDLFPPPADDPEEPNARLVPPTRAHAAHRSRSPRTWAPSSAASWASPSPSGTEVTRTILYIYPPPSLMLAVILLLHVFA